MPFHWSVCTSTVIIPKTVVRFSKAVERTCGDLKAVDLPPHLRGQGLRSLEGASNAKLMGSWAALVTSNKDLSYRLPRGYLNLFAVLEAA